MDDRLELNETKKEKNIVMLTGWRQWADAGSVSSGLPEYIIQQTGARKIGAIKPDDFYFFQVPGAHHLLRPVISIKDGYPQSLETKSNEFYYAGDAEKGLVIFLGDEPHMHETAYAQAYFEAVKRLNVSQIAGVAGVYASVPYVQDRQLSCIYSLPAMRDSLARLAVTFSNYEGGTSIGSYLVTVATAANIPFFVFYGLIPAYSFGQTALGPHGVSIENDFKAWYDIVRRFNHYFELGLDVTDLQKRSEELIVALDKKLLELEEKFPQLNVGEFMDELEENFTEVPFMPLDDVWEQEFRNLFDDLE